MPFCTRCGAAVQSEFCTQCGTRVGSPPPQAGTRPPGPVVIPPPPPAPPVNQAPPGPKKLNPLIWVAAGCAGLIVIAGVIAVSTGVFVAYKAKQAGFDPGLMQKNPGLAVARMIASANPDLEVVSVDDNRGIITVREKKTGKTLTMSLEDAKNGRISFQDETGKKVELEARGDGDSGSLKVRSAEGTMEFNSSAKLPDWVPSYPGAESAGAMAFTSAGQKSAGTHTFKTGDDAARVAAFFEDALEGQGFQVEKVGGQAGQPGMTMLTGKDNEGRTVHVTITPQAAGGCFIGISYDLKQ